MSVAGSTELQLFATEPGPWKLRSPALRVFFFLLPDLSPREFRPVKQVQTARSLGISQPEVSRALTALVAERYLERGAPDAAPRTYRVNAAHRAIRALYA